MGVSVPGSLDACLQNDIRVIKYLFMDPEPRSQQVAHRRLAAMSTARPQHLPLEAWQDAFKQAPQFASKQCASDLHRACTGGGEQLLLIAFWREGATKAGHAATWRAATLLIDICGDVYPVVIQEHETSPREAPEEPRSYALWGPPHP